MLPIPFDHSLYLKNCSTPAIVSSACQFAHVELSLAQGSLQEVTTGSCRYKDGEQVQNNTLIADSSNHSLHLMKIVEIQLSRGKQAERNVTNDLHVNIAASHHENLSLLGTVHHLSGPDMFAHTRSAVCVLCVM